MDVRRIRTMGLVAALLACAPMLACGVLPRFNAAIALSGTVRGEDGVALDGAELHARASRFDLTSESFTSKEERAFELRDGRFEFSCRRCSGVTLHFSKKGYYSETLSFHVDKEVEGTGRLAGEVAQDLHRSDLEIVLRSNANQATLVSYEAMLHATAEGPVRVAPLRRDLGSAGVALEHLDKPPSREARYLPGYVRLLPAVDPKGELAAEPVPDRPGAHMRVPMPPVLDFAPADGGVVLYRYADGNQAAIYREMRTAPESGYVESLVLDQPERGGAYYFYFRAGDRYGKGSVVSPSFGHADQDEAVIAHVELRLNHSGERNVESAR